MSDEAWGCQLESLRQIIVISRTVPISKTTVSLPAADNRRGAGCSKGPQWWRIHQNPAETSLVTPSITSEFIAYRAAFAGSAGRK